MRSKSNLTNTDTRRKSMAFEALFAKYDRLVLFDTETTGLLH